MKTPEKTRLFRLLVGVWRITDFPRNQQFATHTRRVADFSTAILEECVLEASYKMAASGGRRSGRYRRRICMVHPSAARNPARICVWKWLTLPKAPKAAKSRVF